MTEKHDVYTCDCVTDSEPWSEPLQDWLQRQTPTAEATDEPKPVSISQDGGQLAVRHTIDA